MRRYRIVLLLAAVGAAAGSACALWGPLHYTARASIGANPVAAGGDAPDWRANALVCPWQTWRTRCGGTFVLPGLENGPGPDQRLNEQMERLKPGESLALIDPPVIPANPDENRVPGGFALGGITLFARRKLATKVS